MIFQTRKEQEQRLKPRQFSFSKIFRRACPGIFVLLIFIFLLTSLVTYGETQPKFLIIHLDAIPSRYFFQYLEDGYLPNVKAIFEEGHTIKYGLSLFPGGTETIYPRLKEGVGNEKGESVGWGYYDREKGKVVSDLHTFSQLFSSIPRRARASFIYGVPWIDTFMFLPMINIPELLETYGVIELIWFATDAAGHALGEKIYLDSIRKFDSYFGKLIKRLNLAEINLILYCDHGMSFGNEININHVSEVKRVVGEGLEAFLFPHIYLKNVTLKEYYAHKIVQETEIDFAFYKEKEENNSNCVIGYSVQGKVIFEENEEGKIRYLFEGEDVFNYYGDGYRGEWLTDSEWLSLTKESRFPAVPVNIFRLLANKNAGDIVVVVNPPKIIYTKLGYSANHHGVTDTDLLVPILLRGKDLEHLYDREEMWLHTLFTSIPALDFDNIEPEREKNSFSFWGSASEDYYSGFELSLSPAYRWNIAMSYEPDSYKGWFEYDVYSSYVIRLWAGAGLEHQLDNFDPFLNTRLQMDFVKIQFNYGGQVNFSNWKDWQENRKEISYQINDRLSFNWYIPNHFGFTLHW